MQYYKLHTPNLQLSCKYSQESLMSFRRWAKKNGSLGICEKKRCIFSVQEVPYRFLGDSAGPFGLACLRIASELTMKVRFLLICVVALAGCIGCRTGGGGGEPVIGITSVYDVNEATGVASTTVHFSYVQAVADAGGVPIILPTIDDERIIKRYVRELDGLVLVGGADIPPAAYGEQPHQTVKEVPKQRYDFERKLIAQWLDSGKPLLGICLGMQFTNVVAGGSLVQDIPSQIGKKVNHRQAHTVKTEPGSLLAEILGAEQVRVHSYHHQAVKELADGFKIVARSEDGIAEAMERTEGGFGLFVQWQPEAMEDKAHRNAIYGALIRACRARE